jgi:enamine deaminase RidA (YjgF/YER057c/UK114 family)
VFVAGQVGVDAQKRIAGDGGFAVQTERAFDNLERALASAAGAWTDVAKLTIYVVGFDGSQGPVIGQAIRARFPAGRLPACSLIGVQALAEPRFLIEVEAVAVVTGGGHA